ncbi:hypothetical protein BKA69DRAFT_1039541 [Paraphysoderma sedebokerense]|nr:hypothetical protein BKA69DRAFT_638318 [Paraphysoderma sedebokerense]KAI9140066.1 hypothetical protein BKA69DRAFT_1039541 [Paraphysoderma sedebokerense]
MEQLLTDILVGILQFIRKQDLKSLRRVHSIFNEPCRRELFRTLTFEGSTLSFWVFTDDIKWRELKTCSFLPDVKTVRITGRGEYGVSLALWDLFHFMVNLENVEIIQTDYKIEDPSLKYQLPGRCKKLMFENYGSIPLEMFPENLQELSITACLVKPEQVFLFPPQLKRLCLINCVLSSIPYLPQYLQYLDLSLNDLTELPELPPLLRTLICHNTKLTRLPPLPNSLRALELWSTPNTFIETLPSGLETLIISHSPHFLQRFSQLPPRLIQLCLHDCEIESIPHNYLPTSLRSLDLSYNKLKILSSLPSKLEVLKLWQNKLRGIPNLPQSLKTLHLSHNELTELQELPAKLQTLRCDHNRISEWPRFPKTLKIVRINCNILLDEAMSFAATMFNSIDELQSNQ